MDVQNVVFTGLLHDLIRIADPLSVWMFSHKDRSDGTCFAAKFCLVVADGEPDRLEQELYLEIDSPISFDVLVYTQEQWRSSLAKPMSFASRVQEMGCVLYEKDQTHE